MCAGGMNCPAWFYLYEYMNRMTFLDNYIYRLFSVFFRETLDSGKKYRLSIENCFII